MASPLSRENGAPGGENKDAEQPRIVIGLDTSFVARETLALAARPVPVGLQGNILLLVGR